MRTTIYIDKKLKDQGHKLAKTKFMSFSQFVSMLLDREIKEKKDAKI